MYTSVMAFDNIATRLAEEGFVQLSPESIEQIHRLYIYDRTVRIASETSLSSLLNGGIMFRLKSKTMEGSAADSMANTWLPFTRRVVASLWKYGLVVWGTRKCPVLGAVPFVVDLTSVAVHMKRELDGTAEYVVMEKDVCGDHSQPRIITDVRVYESRPPSRSGELESIMKTIYHASSRLRLAESLEDRAASINAHPELVMESTQDPEDDAGAVFGDMPQWTEAGVARGGARPPNPVTTALNDLAFYKNALRGMMLPETARNSAPHIPLRYLPRGYRATGATQVSGPTYVDELRESYEEMVGALFGVPRSFWAQFSASRSSNSPDARLMHENQQRSLKQHVVPFLSTVFRATHGKTLPEVANASKKKQSRQDTRVAYRTKHTEIIDGVDSIITDSVLYSAEDMDVMLPGLPPVERFLHYYELDLVSPEVMVEFISQVHGVPLQEMNGSHKPKRLLDIKQAGATPRPTKKAKTASDVTDHTQ